jgi:hypothetical protein
MKFLLDNFSDSHSTQSLYLNKHLNDIGYVSNIRMDPHQSLYDALDIYSPDIYISSIPTFSKDALFYIKENAQRNIKLIMCINGANQSIVDKVEDLLKANEIDCLFFFGNKKDVNTKFIKYITVQEAADINILEARNELKYNIQKAVIVTDKSKVKNYSGTYHVISLSQNMNKCDFFVPASVLTHLYQNYDEIIFTDFEGYIPQYFFDAVARNKKIYYDINDINVENKVNDILTKVLKLESHSLNYNSENKLKDFSNLNKYVLEKHTGLNRTKTIISQLPQQKLLETTND